MNLFYNQHKTLANFKILEDRFESYKNRKSVYSDVKFDLITLIDVIEHLPDPVEQIKELSGMLKPNGKIFLRLPVINGILFSKKTPQKWK